MEKFVYYGMLLDIYQNLLSDKNKNIFKLYYEENLTLQEIADNLNVSKSYIGRTIKNTERRLETLEDKLHIYQKKVQLAKLLEINDIDNIKKNLQRIID